MSESQTDVGLAIIRGHVVMKFDQAVSHVILDPQNAFYIAEQLARHAHEARFGDQVRTDQSYLAEQISARITDELRDAMIQRVSLVLPQLIERKWTPGRAAMEIVDIVLNAAQGRTVT